MAILKSKTLFFTTSPRTPMKMIPEIELLANNFSGKIWNTESQMQFIELLSADSHFEGEGSQKDLAFSARDRINRAPKALGFVDLKPNIQLTAAGKEFVYGRRKEEILLRQLLKFQLPSPYHIPSDKGSFYVKPYLEILRLVYTLERVTFDELMVFGMQLTHYKKFDDIVNRIKNFRAQKELYNGNYNIFFNDVLNKELQKIYENEILHGETSTRESSDSSLEKFKKTKRSNLRDYTDACFRYLRATGLIAISHKGRALSIMPEKIKDTEYILANIERKPIFVDDDKAYKSYFFDATTPLLYTDNKENLIEFITAYSEIEKDALCGKSLSELKDIQADIIEKRKQDVLTQQISELKSYNLYNDVLNTYNDILNDDLYDTPLMLEWNTWRAMTMMDGGNIIGNFNVDNDGQPLSTAAGNTPDIVCDYEKFGLTVEVTMQCGQRQYEMEGEPVARHLAKYKKEVDKEAFCLFVAPKINNACIAHFFTLSKTSISYYGGKSIIVPMPLDTFIQMVKNSYQAPFIPTPQHIRELFDYAAAESKKDINEVEWYNNIQKKAINWLVA